MEGKVIGAGFQKTGTSSLREALKILGYRVKDTSSRPLIPILRGDFARVERMIRSYDAVEDTPWFMIYRELDRIFPGSKFILTLRDEESWYRSVSRHIGVLRNPNHEWIYGRGKGLPMEDRDHTLRVYREHNAGVREYFRDRPGDLLEVDFTRGDGWPVLCRFLDKPEPGVPFPHANRWEENRKDYAYYGEKRSFAFLRKSIRYRIKIWYMDQKGYFNRNR